MKDRSDDLSHHERMLLPRSYISLLVSGGRHLRKRRTITDVERKKGGNALFTVILHYIIRDYSDYERGNPFPPLHRIFFPITIQYNKGFNVHIRSKLL